MPINVSKIKQTGGKEFKRQEPLEEGAYPARVVQVIDLGLQPQREYQGQQKGPKYELYTTYELTDAFMKDDDGNEIEDKPRWISERFPLSAIDNEKAKSTKRYMALDPQLAYDGDFSQVVEAPCIVTVGINEGTGKHIGKTFENVLNVGAMRAKDAARLPELKNPTKVFTLDNPDLEVFNSLPEFLQTIIKSNLEYAGSPLERLLSGEKPAPKANPKAKAEKPVESDTEGSTEEGDDLPW